MSSNILVISLLVINLLASLIYFAVSLKPRGAQESIYRFIVALLLPVFGLVFFLLTWLFEKITRDTENIIESYEKFIKEEGHIDYVREIDMEKEINIVPIEDSLSLSSFKDRRAFLIDLLKKDYSRHIIALQKAVKNVDSETSHYAGAALMEIKKQFDILLHSANKKFEANKNDISTIMEYIEVIKKYLNSNLPDEVSSREYNVNLSYLIEKLLLKKHDDKQLFIDKILIDLKLGNYDNAKVFIEKFRHFFPNNAEPYMMLLRFFYETNNHKSLLEIIDSLKKVDVKLSARDLDIINYWKRFSINAN